MQLPESISDPAQGAAADRLGDVLAFAGLRLDLPGRILTGASGMIIPLTPGEFRLLEAFLRNAGRVLRRDQLLDVVSRRPAEPFDRSIDVLVGRLRRKIEPNPAAPQVIVTIPGFGYKFAARPHPVVAAAVPATDSDSPPPLREGVGAGAASPSPSHGIRACPLLPGDVGEFGRQQTALGSDKPALAVLQFANLGGGPAQDGFCDGLADDILTELAHSRSLSVISRNSSVAYRGRSVDVRQVGRELGARYVLEGSVRRVAGRVRINAQLIDAATGTHVWAERYDRALRGVFSVQEQDHRCRGRGDR